MLDDVNVAALLSSELICPDYYYFWLLFNLLDFCFPQKHT